MAKPPKTTNVYGSTSEGISDILGASIDDEPTPTPRAADLVTEAQRVGPLNPLVPSPDDLPALDGGPDPGGLDTLPAASPRESAENLVTLLFALAPSGDWQPDDEAEREELTAAVERVFVYRGIAPSLPPELALLAVAGKYTRKRMQRPAVAARLAPFLARLPLVGKLTGAAAAVDQADAGGSTSSPGPFGALPKMSPPADAR